MATKDIKKREDKQEMKPICISTEITEPWYFTTSEDVRVNCWGLNHECSMLFEKRQAHKEKNEKQNEMYGMR